MLHIKWKLDSITRKYDFASLKSNDWPQADLHCSNDLKTLRFEHMHESLDLSWYIKCNLFNSRDTDYWLPESLPGFFKEAYPVSQKSLPGVPKSLPGFPNVYPEINAYPISQQANESWPGIQN